MGTKIVLVLPIVLLGISIPLVFGENFVGELNSEVITLESAKSVYTDNDVIYISGSVSSVDTPSVLIGIHDPFGMPTGFYFGNIDSNNEFSISFLAKAGINFKIEGKYDATAYYSDSKKIVYFDFVESLDDEIFETETIEESTPTETIEDNLIIIKESQIKADIQDDVLQETKIKNDINDKKNNAIAQVSTNNLSVEDTELGKLLNQIALSCEQNEYTDTISYYDGMGPALIRLCKYSEAIFYFDEDIKNAPNDVEILTNKGTALSKLGHFEEAILYYDSALAIDSSYVPALNNKGNALSQLGKFEEAIDVYNLGMKLNSENKILKENFEKSMIKIPLQQYHEETSEDTDHQIDKNNNDNFKIKNNNSIPNLFEKIGSIFSSIGSIFGFN
ncbi:MAG: tetratricopeptide repeat protein [Thaumarchaeota archaeon]|nr:tetratricopeptide repeat protein [Nitrososphaerota archaeon]